ncbi:MAG: hypothetical protein PHR90_00710 [Sphaerochaetaceae bacterium]|nr:hypothetical protein [Sphaerochaetaceae bacterium]
MMWYLVGLAVIVAIVVICTATKRKGNTAPCETIGTGASPDDPWLCSRAPDVGDDTQLLPEDDADEMLLPWKESRPWIQ